MLCENTLLFLTWNWYTMVFKVQYSQLPEFGSKQGWTSVGYWINWGPFRPWHAVGPEKQWSNHPWKDKEKTQMHITEWKKPPEKSPYCMIPCLWCSGKGKTMETVKWSMVVRACGERSQEEKRGMLGQWNCSVWCPDGGGRSLQMFSNL